MFEAVIIIIIIAVPLNLAVLSHMPSLARTIIRSGLITGSVPGCSYSVTSFQAALESPFSYPFRMAISPPATLFNFTLITYSSFSTVLLFTIAIVRQCNRVCQENLLIFSNRKILQTNVSILSYFSNITPSEAPQCHHTYLLPVHNRHTLPSDVR